MSRGITRPQEHACEDWGAEHFVPGLQRSEKFWVGEGGAVSRIKALCFDRLFTWFPFRLFMALS